MGEKNFSPLSFQFMTSHSDNTCGPRSAYEKAPLNKPIKKITEPYEWESPTNYVTSKNVFRAQVVEILKQYKIRLD